MSSLDTGESGWQPKLLAVARRSIEVGLQTRGPLSVEPTGQPAELQRVRASFVTLRLSEALRGCLGSLTASRPLISDVAHNAFGAAFRDSRFAPLTAAELPDLEIQISVLSEPERLPAASESQLLDALRPGVDGLVLRHGDRQGTFLPSVWACLPEPGDFLRELKRKSGLPADAWSSSWQVFRYTTVSIP